MWFPTLTTLKLRVSNAFITSECISWKFHYTTTSAVKVSITSSFFKNYPSKVSMWNLIADFTFCKASSYVSLYPCFYLLTKRYIDLIQLMLYLATPCTCNCIAYLLAMRSILYLFLAFFYYNSDYTLHGCKRFCRSHFGQVFFDKHFSPSTILTADIG